MHWCISLNNLMRSNMDFGCCKYILLIILMCNFSIIAFALLPGTPPPLGIHLSCMLHSLPSALSVWVCTRSFRYAGRALGTRYHTARGNLRQWRLWICLRLHASGHAATATCGPFRRAAPRMKIRLLWTQSHHHPPLQATASAPIPVSTSEVKVGAELLRISTWKERNIVH